MPTAVVAGAHRVVTTVVDVAQTAVDPQEGMPDLVPDAVDLVPDAVDLVPDTVDLVPDTAEAVPDTAEAVLHTAEAVLHTVDTPVGLAADTRATTNTDKRQPGGSQPPGWFFLRRNDELRPPGKYAVSGRRTASGRRRWASLRWRTLGGYVVSGTGQGTALRSQTQVLLCCWHGPGGTDPAAQRH
jgi:hypothetical protein